MVFNSPFSHALYTNYAPTDAELQEIRVFCVKPRTELLVANREVERLEALLEQARQKRDELKELVDSHQALMSPIRRLSPEVLQKIFVFCLPTDRNAVMHDSEAPLLLGRVCKHWRTVAYNTAELWSSLHTVIPTLTSPKFCAFVLNSLKQWLGRSGKCGLSLSLSLHGIGDVQSHDIILQYLEVYLTVIDRWRDVSFSLPTYCMEKLDEHFSKYQNPPKLQLLSLKCIIQNYFDNSETPRFANKPCNASFGLLRCCPNLRRVWLHSPVEVPLFHSETIQTLAPHASQLLVLRIDICFTRKQLPPLFHLISSCPNLTFLSVAGKVVNPDGVDDEIDLGPPPSVTLVDLDILVINLAHIGREGIRSASGLVLERIIAPNLRGLEIKDYSDDFDPADSLMKLLDSSRSMEIFKFEVSSWSWDMGRFKECLARLGSLKHMIVVNGIPGAEEGRDLFTHLQYQENSTALCPNLERLTLKHAGNLPCVDFESESLRQFLSSRLNPPMNCKALQIFDIIPIAPRIFPQRPTTHNSDSIPPSFRDFIATLEGPEFKVVLPEATPQSPKWALPSPWWDAKVETCD